MRYLPGLASRASLLALPLVAALWTHATPAQACGGFACDGPNGMSVDQSGENILFAFKDGKVEVHIQVAYDPNTEASKFAWVIPIQSLPEFHVGSQILFDNVLNGTVPFYGFNTQTEICGDEDFGGGDGGAPNDGGVTGGDSGGTSTGGGGGPEVVFQGQVGAFDITVLKGGTAVEVMDWLADNGYNQPPEAESILQQYLDEGHLFAALKLAPSDDPIVHPIVLVYDGVEPCVPIRLTRIAAVQDMDIRVFFLGDHRAIPTNYRHVLVNPLKINWPGFADNYKEVITAAVDSYLAEGNAFVTEYAGTTSVISQANLYSPSWDAKAFQGLPVTEIYNNLSAQNLMFCDEYSYQCFYNHPLLEGVLRSYITVPDGVGDYEFWTCMSCFEDLIDPLPWGDGAAFSTDLVERIIEPGQRALNLLQTKPYVTRMYTTISPHEMMADPMFAENPNLPEIPSQRMAQRYLRCDGHAEWTLPDGRVVFVPDNGPWPEFPGEMPWEEEVDQMAMAGAPQVLVTNTVAIDKILADWNSANTPKYDLPGADTADTAGTGDAAGCGCSTQDPSGALAALTILGIAGLGRRRRR
jgi:MYXO-CTERM domain-containing protein